MDGMDFGRCLGCYGFLSLWTAKMLSLLGMTASTRADFLVFAVFRFHRGGR